MLLGLGAASGLSRVATFPLLKRGKTLPLSEEGITAPAEARETTPEISPESKKKLIKEKSKFNINIFINSTKDISIELILVKKEMKKPSQLPLL